MAVIGSLSKSVSKVQEYSLGLNSGREDNGMSNLRIAWTTCIFESVKSRVFSFSSDSLSDTSSQCRAMLATPPNMPNTHRARLVQVCAAARCERDEGGGWEGGGETCESQSQRK
jgi:hypothetical protein